MTSLAIITPSYAADFELCADLSASVRRFGPDSADHHIVVPSRDVARFRQLRAAHCHVHEVADFLPRRFVAVPGNLWVNLARPIPPIRGWVVQQIIKLSVTAALECDAALLVDSDLQFIRPLRVDSFVRNGIVRFYRRAAAVDGHLPGHLVWHEVSRVLLGLGPLPAPPLADYVCWPAPWDPRVVRSLLARVEEVTERPWPDAIAMHTDFSAEILYGVYLDDVLGAPANSFATPDMLCHRHNAEVALDEAGLAAFLAGVAPDDVAVMISARSGTPLPLRRAGLHAQRPS